MYMNKKVMTKLNLRDLDTIVYEVHTFYLLPHKQYNAHNIFKNSISTNLYTIITLVLQLISRGKGQLRLKLVVSVSRLESIVAVDFCV